MGDQSKLMTLNLKIWQQPNNDSNGEMVDYKLSKVSPDMSFLECLMSSMRNLLQRKDPVAFDHDCRRYLRDVLPHGQWASSWTGITNNHANSI